MENKEKALSLFLNVDRAYVCLMERDNNNINLSYISSTDSKIDPESIDDEQSQKGLDELKSIFSEIDIPKKINLTLPSESVLVTTFPGKPDITHAEIVKLVELEIKQLYPQLTLEQFSIFVTQLAPTKEGKYYMLASIINDDLINSCRNIIEQNNAELGKIEISQFAAHNSFMFNYPEIKDQNVLLVSIQNQFMDVSLLTQGETVYYNLLSVTDNAKIAEIFENECNKIQETIVDQINQAFFFGSSLTKELNMLLWETSMLFGFETKRLNPFRMMSTTLEGRKKEYCSRVFHLFPAVVGVNLPSVNNRIKIVS